MTITDADLIERVKAVFADAPFVAALGLELRSVGAGEIETYLALERCHLQQHGFVHAGVQATMADHSSGCAATTFLPSRRAVLTAEFKISLLRPARGEALVCRARVIKPGRKLSATEADVFAIDGGAETHVSRMSATMAIVDIPA